MSIYCHLKQILDQIYKNKKTRYKEKYAYRRIQKYLNCLTKSLLYRKISNCKPANIKNIPIKLTKIINLLSSSSSATTNYTSSQ